MEIKKILLIVVFLYSVNLLSQNTIYQPVEKYFDKIIVEKSNYNFKDDSTFNSELPEYLKVYAEGTFLKEFGSWEKFPSNIEMFDSISSENFKDNWNKYKNKLIEVCKSKHLDHISLTKCLEIVKNDNKKNAILPIAAYQCKHNDHDVWVIICAWEYKDLIKKISKTDYISYGHIREFAIDITNFKIIAFSTCG